jgi:hypothetical protein
MKKAGTFVSGSDVNLNMKSYDPVITSPLGPFLYSLSMKNSWNGSLKSPVNMNMLIILSKGSIVF